MLVLYLKLVLVLVYSREYYCTIDGEFKKTLPSFCVLLFLKYSSDECTRSPCKLWRHPGSNYSTYKIYCNNFFIDSALLYFRDKYLYLYRYIVQVFISVCDRYWYKYKYWTVPHPSSFAISYLYKYRQPTQSAHEKTRIKKYTSTCTAFWRQLSTVIL